LGCNNGAMCGLGRRLESLCTVKGTAGSNFAFAAINLIYKMCYNYIKKEIIMELLLVGIAIAGIAYLMAN